MKAYQLYLLLATPLASCSSLNPVDRTPSVSGLGGAPASAGGAQATGAGGAGGAGGAAQGLPCEVQAILVKYCGSCHGAIPSSGAPRSLLSYADLTRPDLMNPSISEAQAALQRVQDKASPMPPAPTAGPTAAEVATLQGWVSSGYPAGSCASGSGGASGGGSGGVSNAGAGGGTAGSGGTRAGGAGGSGAGGGTDTGGSLPCDVQALFVSRCDSCHGSTPSGGAPRSLVTYANLTSPDPASPSMTEAQVALQRMQSTTSPMPPATASPATAAEIATLANWINSGYPSGSCGGDAGPPPTDPLNASPTCTSKTTWRGNEGSSTMAPGQACISCHAGSGGEAPRFVIAGTLYPTGHEPDNCNGASGSQSGAKVVVTGSNGNSVSLTPNSAGNFYSSSTLPGPYKAKVVTAAGAERAMSSTASTGDCNSCHTQNGANGAPGRITVP